MKFLKKLFIGLASIGMAIGVGASIGNNNVTAVKATNSTYSHTFSTGEIKAAGGSTKLDGITWSFSSAKYIGFSNGSGAQIGSANNPAASWTIQTPVSSFDANAIIKKVTVNAKTGGTSTVKIACGGTDILTVTSLTTNLADYSNASDANISSGDLIITMASTSKAMYLYSIKVEYMVQQDYVTTLSGTTSVASFTEGSPMTTTISTRLLQLN